MSSPAMKNKRVVCIAGESSAGKSSSLRHLYDKDGVLYLNFEHKDLPFGFDDKDGGEFSMEDIFDTDALIGSLQFCIDNPDEYHTVVFDTATFMFDIINRELIQESADTQKGWAHFQNFIKDLMQNYVGVMTQSVIFLAHLKAELNPNTGENESKIPIQGALKNNGFEAFFSVVVHAKTVPLRRLDKCNTGLLSIATMEELMGLKYVFQVHRTKETIGDRIRSPIDMFPPDEPYMDNDAQLLLDVLEAFYVDGKRNITEI